jgi:ribosomal protein S18 acetylase RimI-like enzyme
MNPRFKIGMRTIKTALAVGICLEVFYLLNIGSNINGVQAAFAATICMKSSLQQSLKTGFDRTMGTIIGAALGILFLMIEAYIPHELFILVATAGVVVVIYLCNVFRLQLSVTISVVVYVSILITQRTVTPLVYGVERLGETMFGIFVAFVINKFLDPRYFRRKQKALKSQALSESFIRGYNKKDIGRIMQIWLGTNTRAHGTVAEIYWHEQYDAARKAIRAAATLVYDSGGVAGFISVVNDTEIYAINVDRASQGSGIGTQLLEEFQNRFPCLTVRVFKENERAVKFFLNRGFTFAKETVNESASRPECTLEWSRKSKGACNTSPR